MSGSSRKRKGVPARVRIAEAACARVMKAGWLLLDAGHAKVMEGRAEAVTNAVMQAQENDVVLVAGKGHEDYQIVGNRRLDYSDRVTVARLLGAVA